MLNVLELLEKLGTEIHALHRSWLCTYYVPTVKTIVVIHHAWSVQIAYSRVV